MNAIPGQPTVVVLGGVGGMGRVAVGESARFADLGELVVADLDLGAAERVVAETAPSAETRLRAAAVDVSDPDALGALLEAADVVLNTTGPFYRLGVPVLRAAIEACCHYVDICDDWEPTIDMLELHGEAASRGVLAVIGLGASPGASNLLARLACDRLERVDDLYTAWPVDVGDEDTSLDEAVEASGAMSAALIHWMLQISGTIEVIEAGERVTRPPLEPVTLDYPGVGPGTGYTVGHPEPITLRESMGVRGSCANLMLLKTSTAAYLDALRNDMDAGKLTLEEAAARVARPGVARQAKALVRAIGLDGPGHLPPFFAWARGVRDGRPTTVGVHVNALPPGMARVTSVPLALGLRQLLDARLEATGVHPPETVIEPAPFFEGLAKACDPPLGGMDSLVVVTEER